MSVLIFVLTVMISNTCARYIEGFRSEESIEWLPSNLSHQNVSPNEFTRYFVKNDTNWSKLLPKNNQLSLFSGSFTIEDLINKTYFYLYTEKNRHYPQMISIDDTDSITNSFWDPSKDTKIIIHGFYSNSTDVYIKKMKDNLLNLNESLNVIAFDWSPFANLFYPFAASLTDQIGKVCGLFINTLCDNGGFVENFHLIGHSLGAHVAGFAARSVLYGKIGRVTGLDPALPGFMTEGKSGRLDASDAKFVDCIHTCGGLIAFLGPICHADYYPNGGYSPQPGCAGFIEGPSCSHSRAHDLFVESILKEHKFPAFTCPEIPEKDSVLCLSEGAVMGYPAQSKYKGIFYAITNSEFPFSTEVNN